MNNMTTNYQWKPAYKYEMGIIESAKLFLCGFLCAVLILFSLVLASAEVFPAMLFTIGLAVFFLKIFMDVYNLSSVSYIKSKFQTENVEYFDDDFMSGMLLVKTGKGLMGIYVKKDRDFLFKPQFKEIKNTPTYLLLKNEAELYGVYNKELAKMVLPCEYYSVTDNKDGNLLAKKGTQGYIFTHYGTLVKEWSIAEQFGRVMEDMIGKMGK